MRLNFNRTLWYIMCVPLKAECVIKRRILDYWESVALCVVYPGGARALPIFRGTNKSAFSSNAQSRFASVVLDGVLGPLRLECHTWRLRALDLPNAILSGLRSEIQGHCQVCRVGRRGPRTPSRTTDANLDCAFAENALFYIDPWFWKVNRI